MEYFKGKEESQGIVPYKDPNLVILRNPVAKAKFGLSVVQTKILFEIITYFKNNPERRLMRFYVRDYLNQLGYDTKNLRAYTDEIEAMTKLHLQIPEGENKRGINYLAVNLLSGARFRIDERGLGYVDIEVSEMLKPYFLEIAKGDFFHYHIVNTRVLKSMYSIKLYLLLKSYRRFQTFEISVAELRGILEIHPDEYTRYKDFKKRVLERAREEMREKNDIYFTYNELRARPNNSKSEVIKIQFLIQDNPDRPDIKEKIRQLELQDKQKARLEKRKTKAEKTEKELSQPLENLFSIVDNIEDLEKTFDNLVTIPPPSIRPDFLNFEPQKEQETAFLESEFVELFQVFDQEATVNEIRDFIEGLRAEDPEHLLDVLLYAKQAQQKGNAVKNIYAYVVSGLKSRIGKGLAQRQRKKQAQQRLDAQGKADHQTILEWIEKEFKPFAQQYYLDLGATTATAEKRQFVQQKRDEAVKNAAIRKQFFNPDGSLRPDELRLAMGIEQSMRRGETHESIFVHWAADYKNVTVRKQNDRWAMQSLELF